MQEPALIVMAGLPGAGKSSVADALARRTGRPVLSVDPIEAAMWRSGIPASMTGIAAYRVAEAVAADCLRLGVPVIVDAVNPVEAARDGWLALAARYRVRAVFVECVCPDLALHRARIEGRRRGIESMADITWDAVEVRRREYEPWHGARIVLDTSRDEPERLADRVLADLDLRGA
jgi:predicted kinase